MASKEIFNYQNGRVYVEETTGPFGPRGQMEKRYQALHSCGYAYCEMSKSKEEVMNHAMTVVRLEAYLYVEECEELKYGGNA